LCIQCNVELKAERETRRDAVYEIYERGGGGGIEEAFLEAFVKAFLPG